MRVVDLSTRAQAPIVNELTLTAVQAEDVAATATHPEMLLASTNDALHILSAANPLAPQPFTTIAMPHAVPFASAGDTTYVAIDGTLSTVDLVTGAMNPTTMRVSSPIQLAAAANGKIVVADRYALRVFGPRTTAPPPPPPPAPPRTRPVRH